MLSPGQFLCLDIKIKRGLWKINELCQICVIQFRIRTYCIEVWLKNQLVHLFSFKYFNGEKCLIYINLCTFHVKKNSARLQWYSCARYKAPGPLVQIFGYSFTQLFSEPEQMSGEQMS